MANPNILQTTTIAKKTRAFSASTTLTTLVDNPSSSDMVIKINSVRFSYPQSGVSNTSIKLFINTTQFSNTNLAPDESVVLVDGNQSFFLTEGQALGFTASSSTGDIIVTYTEMS